MPSERADRLTGGQTNVVCLMSRREFDDTGQTCSREYRSGVEFHVTMREMGPKKGQGGPAERLCNTAPQPRQRASRPVSC
jgi:hypothetical protein